MRDAGNWNLLWRLNGKTIGDVSGGESMGAAAAATFGISYISTTTTHNILRFVNAFLRPIFSISQRLWAICALRRSPEFFWQQTCGRSD